MKRAAVVAMDGVVPFDLATPLEVFGRVTQQTGRPGYVVRVCCEHGSARSRPFVIEAEADLNLLGRADLIVVPGNTSIDRASSPALLKALQRQAKRGTRIVSICTGAFVLAEAGLLDGRRATTHWAAASELARRFPAVTVDPAVLYVDEGQVMTSAGAAAGLDLCLHIVRRDYGAVVAAETARLCVMPLERAGGQAQFIAHETPEPDGSSLEPVLRWIEGHLRSDVSAAVIARRAGMSVRTLNRRFKEQVGTTPAQWILGARVRKAQRLLETTRHSVEAVAEQVGFGSASALRERFRAQVGISPVGYRKGFGGRR